MKVRGLLRKMQNNNNANCTIFAPPAILLDKSKVERFFSWCDFFHRGSKLITVDQILRPFWSQNRLSAKSSGAAIFFETIWSQNSAGVRYMLRSIPYNWPCNQILPEPLFHDVQKHVWSFGMVVGYMYRVLKGQWGHWFCLWEWKLGWLEIVERSEVWCGLCLVLDRGPLEFLCSG